MRTVEIALESADIPRDRFDVLPFPIEDPKLLTQFLPVEVAIFTTTYDQWNQQKIQTLESAGYKVINLWNRNHKTFEGKNVRSLMCSGDERWKLDVPDAVATYLEEIEIPKRLRSLAEPQEG
jgi:nicotinamide mononucleotide adenylyltransferase